MYRKTGRLAIDGGEKVRKRAFAPWPLYDREEIAAASAVLQSGKVNYWTGNQGRLFEEEFAAASESKHAVAVGNGTVALELALQALEIGVGDEVIVPSRSFIASASSVVMRNATPVFADIDEESQTVTGETIEAVVTNRTKAIIAVHLAGWPCKMDGILSVARRYNLKVIEDCAQAQGARYLGRPVGSFGDAAAFSFCQDKIMSTGGEGGMLVTSNDSRIMERMLTLHAICRQAENFSGFMSTLVRIGGLRRCSRLSGAVFFQNSRNMLRNAGRTPGI